MIAHLAPWVYIGTLVLCVICLGVGHRTKAINLWDCVTTTKGGQVFTDPKKLAYIGAFVLMGTAFAYLALLDRLTEWYAGAFVSAFVIGKWLGDREQRLNRAIEVQKPAGG